MPSQSLVSMHTTKTQNRKVNMEFVNPKDLKPKRARELVMELQLRLLKVENCLDDIARAAEIAQFSRQYDVTNAFCRDAEEL